MPRAVVASVYVLLVVAGGFGYLDAAHCVVVGGVLRLGN